ncbi:MAG: helix-turn-helix domain-containing protein [Bdellovibrionaceae bacterium]|nr:helix-turn-helix domain-containing protein [Pseudobdellovibrionaceae bacterium]
MDQNVNQPKKTIGEMLKELADQARAQDKADAEARRLGQPIKTITTSVFEEKAIAYDTQVSSMPKESENEILLNSSEAAKLLSYTEKSFRNAVAAGKIPHYKLLGQNRFKKSELLSLLVKVELKNESKKSKL